PEPVHETVGRNNLRRGGAAQDRPSGSGRGTSGPDRDQRARVGPRRGDLTRGGVEPVDDRGGAHGPHHRKPRGNPDVTRTSFVWRRGALYTLRPKKAARARAAGPIRTSAPVGRRPPGI